MCVAGAEAGITGIKSPMIRMLKKHGAISQISNHSPAAKIISKTPAYAANKAARNSAASGAKKVRKVAQPRGSAGLVGGRNFFGG